MVSREYFGVGLVVFALAALVLGGCQTGTGGAGTGRFDAKDLAAKRPKNALSETTLSKFCNNPPKATSRVGIDSLTVYCDKKFLGHSGNSKVFDMGGGRYRIAFAKLLEPKEICSPKVPKDPMCNSSGILAGEKIGAVTFNVH